MSQEILYTAIKNNDQEKFSYTSIENSHFLTGCKNLKDIVEKLGLYMAYNDVMTLYNKKDFIDMLIDENDVGACFNYIKSEELLILDGLKQENLFVFHKEDMQLLYVKYDLVKNNYWWFPFYKWDEHKFTIQIFEKY